MQDVLSVNTFGLGAIEADPHDVGMAPEEGRKVVGNDAGVVYCRVQTALAHTRSQHVP